MKYEAIIKDTLSSESNPLLNRVKRLAAVALVGLGTIGVNTLIENEASAAPDTYPWQHAQDYNPGSYMWWVDENGNGRADVTSAPNDNDEAVDPNGYYYRNCTSYAAAKLKQLGYAGSMSGLGNAKSWDDIARSRGVGVDNSPRVGDAAVWDYIGNDSRYGHVAIVEKVYADGSVDVSEYNAGLRGGYTANRHTRAHKYVHFLNRPSGTPNIAPPASQIPYAAIADGQEYFSDQNWVYTKVGGTAWPIKHRNDWNSGDTFNWGGAPIGPVSTRETWDHEAGYNTNNQRQVGAHPPTEGTVVHIEGTSQQYYFFRGHAYPIGIEELDDLQARNKARRVPAFGNRLMDFVGIVPPFGNGELYRYASVARVNQFITNGDGSHTSYHVNNDTVLDCLEFKEGRHITVLPKSAQSLITFNLGPEVSQPAACDYPNNSVVLGPNGAEFWKIRGDNSSTPYTRHYIGNELTAWLNSGGRPVLHRSRSVQALNDIPQGPDTSNPEGIYFVNNANGDVFLWLDNQAHKVPSNEVLSCLGNPSLVRVDGQVVGPLHQAEPVSC